MKFIISAFCIVFCLILQCMTVQAKDIPEDMRAVWIPCMSLQLSENERSEDGFRRKAEDIINRCAENDINTVIVQVRPFSDALYKSEYFPVSHVLAGVQGGEIDFDALEIITGLAHDRNISVHAWINPLRIGIGAVPDRLSADNPYMKWKNDDIPENDGYTFTCDNGLYYDPSYPEVRRLIINGVRELAENYDIDGVQIDDYFYPDDNNTSDTQSYEAYKSSLADGCIPLSHHEWRKNNINMLVSGLYSAVHSCGKDIVFGISPQGNFDNDEILCADIKSWCNCRGYADYICPQLYVSNEHPVFPFESLADKWKSFVGENDIRLYYGLALYKLGTDADSGTWLGKPDMIDRQKKYSENADGYMLYSYEYL
ncbi:MAG: family 10 glycosylhydrolase [Clostridia bacterium]|nr:family 10 glycosylhydrolase [Clostridia bacterium]